MARLTLILCAVLAAGVLAGSDSDRPRPPQPPPKRPDPSGSGGQPPAGSGGAGSGGGQPPAGSGQDGSKPPKKPDFGDLFGFNRTTVPPQIPTEVKNSVEDLLRKAGQDNDDVPRPPAPGQRPSPDDVSEGLRRAAPEAIRAARNNSMVDPDGRPFVTINSPNGTIIMKTFNALGHARCNLTTLMKVADHWVSLPSGENFIRGIRNDSILVVSAAPRNRHGRGRRNHTVHSDILDISVTDGNGNEVPVNSSTIVDGATVDTTIVVNGGDTSDTGKMKCAWWDETNQIWSTDGCTSKPNPDGGYVDCSCNHLTSFALVTPNDSGSSGLSAGAIAGIAIGACAVVGLVVGLSIFAVKRSKQRKIATPFTSPVPAASTYAQNDSSVVVVLPGARGGVKGGSSV